MAKRSTVERDLKRRRIVEKFAQKRLKLKAMASDFTVSQEARWDAMQALQKLPRDANPVRLRNRCELTGRPRGVYRKFKLCRNKLRLYAMSGNIPGLKKASW